MVLLGGSTADRSADRRGAIRELLGLSEAAVEQCAHRLPERVVPEVDRVAQLLGEARMAGDLGVGRIDLAQFEQVDDPVEPSLQHELCVAGALGQLHDLFAGGQPVVDRLAIPEGGASGVHGVGERGSVAQPASHLHGLVAERHPPPARLRPVQRLCQSAHHPRAQRAVVLAEHAECLLQQADQDRVDLAEAHAAGRHCRETERRPHEPVGHRGDSRDAGGRFEALARSFGPARSGLRVAERERQLAALGVVGGLAPPQGFERAPVVNGRLFVGEHRGGALRRPPRVVDGLRDVPAGQALEEVVGKLREVRARAACGAAAPAPPRCGDGAAPAARR